MHNVNLLIKPASGNCNLRCQYCFYTDEMKNREVPSYGIMSEDTIKVVLEKTLRFAQKECTVAFQGGEPTLAGLDFFKKVIYLEKELNINGIKIHNAIQTNGTLIDRDWAQFFSENHFLVGLSLDGTRESNDRYRVDAQGEGSFKRIMRCTQLFNHYEVEYNILTVITDQVARDVRKIYNFYKRNGFLYQQYIPCIEPFNQEHGSNIYSLTPEMYARFLKTLFDLWYSDVSHGKFIYIRYFDNILGMIRGYAPESCGMIGRCTNQYVVEADGSVYTCDFYVMDEYKIGNFLTDSFQDMEKKRSEIGFIENSLYVDEKCKSCRWASLCRGGCRRDREPMVDGKLSLNRYCTAYQEFFDYAIERLVTLASKL